MIRLDYSSWGNVGCYLYIDAYPCYRPQIIFKDV